MQWRGFFSTAAVALVLGTGALAAQDTRPGIAVLPFNNGGSYGQDAEDYDALQVGMQQMLTTEFAANGGLRVVDRSQISNLLSEQDLGASGRVDAATAARIGKVVGARFMVMGGFVDTYGTMRLDVQIVNTETSEIVKASSTTFKREELARAVVEAASKITQDLKLPALPKDVQARREERAGKLPAEAVSYYTKGLLYQDRGDNARAAELFRKATEVFPNYTEAEEALKQVSG